MTFLLDSDTRCRNGAVSKTPRQSFWALPRKSLIRFEFVYTRSGLVLSVPAGTVRLDWPILGVAGRKRAQENLTWTGRRPSVEAWAPTGGRLG